MPEVDQIAAAEHLSLTTIAQVTATDLLPGFRESGRRANRPLVSLIKYDDCVDGTFFELSTSSVNYKIREVARKREAASKMRKPSVHGPDQISALLIPGNVSDIAGHRRLHLTDKFQYISFY